MKPHQRLASLSLLIPLSIALVACGNDDPVTVSGNAPTAVNAASSQEWLNAGNDIVAGRAKERLAQANGLSMYPNGKIPTFGPYLTLPVTIDRVGVYALRAGPLRESDTPDPLAAITLPLDITFEWRADLVGQTVEKVATERFLVINLHVSSLQAPYLGLRAWVQ